MRGCSVYGHTVWELKQIDLQDMERNHLASLFELGSDAAFLHNYDNENSELRNVLHSKSDTIAEYWWHLMDYEPQYPKIRNRFQYILLLALLNILDGHSISTVIL